MTVSLESCRCTPEILGDLARCLHTLPNLHTFQITDAPAPMTTRLKVVFSGHQYPNVHTVSIPRFAHNILPSFPEVKTVISTKANGHHFLAPIAKGCPKVESLEGFSPNAKMMQRLIKIVPNLKSIKIVSAVEPDILDMFSSFKQLCSIDLRAPGGATPTRIHEHPRFVACITIARKILQYRDHPQLRIHYQPFTGILVGPWKIELDVHDSSFRALPGSLSSEDVFTYLEEKSAFLIPTP
ncbi:hypothetical protein C0995_011946 [Termitomyces sp. Mi166|nr:hypothetical protein C0995_011946 [Termitomyces sp. Mi166\